MGEISTSTVDALIVILCYFKVRSKGIIEISAKEINKNKFLDNQDKS